MNFILKFIFCNFVVFLSRITVYQFRDNVNHELIDTEPEINHETEDGENAIINNVKEERVHTTVNQ